MYRNRVFFYLVRLRSSPVGCRRRGSTDELISQLSVAWRVVASFFLCLIFDIFIRLFLCLPRLLVLCTDVAITFAGNLEFSVHTSLRDSVFRISVSLGSDVLHFTLRAKFIGAVYCNRSCMWVCLFVCVFVDLLPR